MMNNLFITGTDTNVGKTIVATGVIECIKKNGLSIVGYKPVASGSSFVKGVLRNEDALSLQKSSSVNVEYEEINPYVFEQPIAPHIAAQLEGTKINLDSLIACYNSLVSKADVVVVEGAGGWYVPLSLENSIADLVMRLDLDVILVVDIRLGCINHALLTYQAIVSSGLRILGWVANHAHMQAQVDDYIVNDLKKLIAAPLLAEIPYMENSLTSDIAQYFNDNLFIDETNR